MTCWRSRTWAKIRFWRHRRSSKFLKRRKWLTSKTVMSRNLWITATKTVEVSSRFLASSKRSKISPKRHQKRSIFVSSPSKRADRASTLKQSLNNTLIITRLRRSNLRELSHKCLLARQMLISTCCLVLPAITLTWAWMWMLSWLSIRRRITARHHHPFRSRLSSLAAKSSRRLGLWGHGTQARASISTAGSWRRSSKSLSKRLNKRSKTKTSRSKPRA